MLPVPRLASYQVTRRPSTWVMDDPWNVSLECILGGSPWNASLAAFPGTFLFF